MGLTEFEAETAYALSLIRKGRFSTRVISEAKSQMIRKSGLMEFWSPADINDVGGLGNLKAFIQNRAKAFSPDNDKASASQGIVAGWNPRDWKIVVIKSDCIHSGMAIDTT